MTSCTTGKECIPSECVKLTWSGEGKGDVQGCSPVHPCSSCCMQGHCTAFLHFLLSGKQKKMSKQSLDLLVPEGMRVQLKGEGCLLGTCPAWRPACGGMSDLSPGQVLQHLPSVCHVLDREEEQAEKPALGHEVTQQSRVCCQLRGQGKKPPEGCSMYMGQLRAECGSAGAVSPARGTVQVWRNRKYSE